MTTFKDRTKRASLADILDIASAVARRAKCEIGKQRGGPWKFKDEQATLGSAKVNLLWTEEEINKDVFRVEYPWSASSAPSTMQRGIILIRCDAAAEDLLIVLHR